MLAILDVSGHNDPLAVPYAGVKGVLARATIGAKGVDGSTWAHLTRAGLLGVRLRGVYHYLRGDSDGWAQANHFWKEAEHLGELFGFLALAVDVEDLPPPAKPWEPASYLATLLAFLGRLEELAGRPCANYGSPAYLEALGCPPGLARHPLWVAHWGTSQPKVPRPWSSWTLHQHAVIGGVDRNWFNGTEEDWVRVFGPTPTPPSYDALGGVALAIERAAGGRPGEYYTTDEGPNVKVGEEEAGGG